MAATPPTFAKGDGDFTSQLLYTAIRTGVNVNLADVGLNVLIDLIEYSAKTDAAAMSGNSKTRGPKLGIEGMMKSGKFRG